MGYGQVEARIAAFKKWAGEAGFQFPNKSPFPAQLALVEEFLADMARSPGDAVTKWLQREFLEWYRAMIAVDTLCEVAEELQNHPVDLLKDKLRLATMEDISQDFERRQSKEYLYELQVATWMQQAGFAVNFREPDLGVSGGGLAQPVSIACKYPSSQKKLNDRISEGYRQIAGQSGQGIVAVGMDLLVCEGMRNFIHFPDDDEVVVSSLARDLSDRVDQVARSRAGTPGRTPPRGAMFTLKMVGFQGKPAHLKPAHYAHFFLGKDNPSEPDIVRIAQAMSEIGRTRRP
jgi:hypothetical protein